MAQVLDSIIAVGPLAAGASVTLAHGLTNTSGGLVPTLITPSAPTPIGVVTATATTITFQNYGTSTESASFLARRDHSSQVPAVGAVAAWWSGYTGLQSFLLNATQWDDLRVPVTATLAFGSNPPSFAKFRDSGAVGLGSAIVGDGVTNSAVAGVDFGNFADSFSVCFWMNTTYTAAGVRRICFKDASWHVTLTSGFVRIGLQGLPNTTSTVSYLVGARHFVAITVTNDAIGGTVTVNIYQNNVLTDTVVHVGTLAADNANLLYITSNNAPGQRFPGTLDELRIYQAILTTTDIGEIWNAGVGTTNEPVAAPALLAGYHFDEGVGVTADNYEGTAARDLTLTNITWAAAGLTGSAVTRGVFTWSFDPDVEQELFFTAQMPHGYKEGTALEPHVHWSPPNGAGGNVVWGLEYALQNVDGTFGNTVSLEATASAGAVPASHNKVDLGSIAGSGLKISHMILGRVYRKAAAAADTYAFPAFLLEVDFHYQIDTIGSRTELVK